MWKKQIAWFIKNNTFFSRSFFFYLTIFGFLLFPLFFVSKQVICLVLIFFSAFFFFGKKMSQTDQYWKIRFFRRLRYVPKSEVDIFKENPSLWIRENFHESKSLIRFLLERIFEDSIINEDLFFNLKLIPHSKRLNPETIKRILPTLYFLPKIEADSFKVNESFKDFDESTILRLFTSPFEKIEIIEVFESVRNGFKFKKDFSFRKLHDQIEEKPIYFKKIENLSLKRESIQGVVLRTRHSYKLASEDFSNCSKGYFDFKTNIVVFFKKNEPFACVEIDKKGKIIQIFGKSNRKLSLFDENLIRSIFIT